MTRTLFVIATTLLLARGVTAQTGQSASKAIPIRQLGKITAVARDTLGPRIVTRGLSDGRVLVGVFAYGTPADPGRRRVKLFDSTLQSYKLIFDSTSMPQLIRYFGDTTLALDQPSRSMIVLDGQGKTVRSMAIPKQQDFPGLVGFIRTPWIDPKGRLVYQGIAQRPPTASPVLRQLPFLPDSAPIVRGDFDTRKVDTIAMVKIVKPGILDVKETVGSLSVRAFVDPTSTADEWAMLPDGTIAIVREHDYHIDWIAPDGTRTSTPKMPFEWVRVTDAQKRGILDSLKATVDTLRTQNPPATIPTPDGPIRLSIDFQPLPIDKLPDYEAPIGPGSVRADLEGNLWIVPRTTAAAKGGLLYDVVNRKGEIFERVQLPPGVALVGFGPGGVVYLNRVVGNSGFLERATVR
jgi:hypothetical protein